MNRFQKLSIPVLLLWLASSPRAGSQAVLANETTNASSQVHSGQFASSYTRITAKARKPSGSLRKGAIPSGGAPLYFQPGIGWQSVPVSTPMGAGEPGVPGTPIDGTSGMIEARGSETGGSSISGHAQPLGAKKAMPSERPAMSTSTIAPEALIDDVITGTHSLAGRRSVVSTDQINGLKAHAYVSSIKLRRMIRNAPDLQTRIKLQEIQDKLANKSHISTATSKGNKATKAP